MGVTIQCVAFALLSCLLKFEREDLVNRLYNAVF